MKILKIRGRGLKFATKIVEKLELISRRLHMFLGQIKKFSVTGEAFLSGTFAEENSINCKQILKNWRILRSFWKRRSENLFEAICKNYC